MYFTFTEEDGQVIADTIRRFLNQQLAKAMQGMK